MDQILTLSCYVSPTVALEAGVARHGTTNVPLTDEQLGELSLDERHLIALYLLDSNGRSRDMLSLPAPDASWPAVRAVIAAQAAKAAEDKRLEIERYESRVAEALAAPLDRWVRQISVGNAPELMHSPGVHGVERDARVQARRAQFEPEFRALHDAWREQRVQHYLALTSCEGADPTYFGWATIAKDPRVEAHWAKLREARAASEAEKEAKLEAVRAELRAWAASKIDHLARAAAEGYDVEAAVVAHVVEQIRKSIVGAADVPATDAGAVTIVEGTPDWDRHSWEERSAPHARVLRARDAVVAAVARVELPTCFAVDVLRAMRVEVEDSDGDEGRKFTAIVVAIECPIAKLHAIVVDVD